MTDETIRILLFSVICFAAGFELALILTFGSIRKWRAAGNEFRSGRVAALHEVYRIVSDRQKCSRGDAWNALNGILDVIGAMIPEE